MIIQKMNIGQKVTIKTNYKFVEWQGEDVEVVGLSIDLVGNENITILDKHQDEYDGFKAEDFIFV
jgi:hypothetical protein